MNTIATQIQVEVLVLVEVEVEAIVCTRAIGHIIAPPWYTTQLFPTYIEPANTISLFMHSLPASIFLYREGFPTIRAAFLMSLHSSSNRFIHANH